MRTPAATLPALEERTIGRAVLAAAQHHSDRLAVRDPDGGLSYAELVHRGRQLVRGLTECGVARGDAVLHMLDNHIDHAVTCVGLALGGFVSVPINTGLIGDLLAHLIQDSRSQVVIIEQHHLPALVQLNNRLANLKTVVVRTPDATDEKVKGLSVITLSQFWTEREGEVASPEAWALHSVMYTSGTTGDSKGVLVSHAQTFTRAAVLDLRDPSREREHEVALVTLPLFHVVGQCRGLFSALILGGTAVVLPKFSVRSFWASAAQYGATYTSLLGSMASFLARTEPSPADRAHQVHTVVMAPTISEVIRFAQRFGVRVLSSYGSTEIGSVTSAVATDATCGTLHPEFEGRLVDEFDRTVPTGEIGELVVRSSTPWIITTGYLGRPEATEQAWRNGWFHTGDLFRSDQAARLTFTGRKKDMIRRRGENISAMELERAVANHPAVAECAAVGVPSEDTEDDVKVVVVLRAGCELSEVGLLQFLTSSVPRYMLPRYIQIVTKLPLTATNKVDKPLLGTGATGWDRTQQLDAARGEPRAETVCMED